MTTSTAESTESSIRVILFSGKKAEWETWSEKFQAKAMRRGYQDLLTGKMAIPKSTEVLDEKKEPEKVKARELNGIGFSDLILSMDTEQPAGLVAFKLVKKSKSKDYEAGNIATSWANLKRKYAPKTAPTKISVENEYTKMKMKAGEDPDIFITSMEFLVERLEELGKSVSEEDLIIRILNSLPEGYEIEISQLEEKMGSQSQPTLEDVREKLSLRYTRGKHNHDDDDAETVGGKEETALYAGSQFKGKCNFCGKYGHKQADCMEKKLGKPKPKGTFRFNGYCRYCNKKGHKEFECQKKKKDQARNNSGGGNNNGGSEAAEVVLMAEDIDGNDMNERVEEFFEIGVCLECNDQGPIGCLCSQCADTGMIYEQVNNSDNESTDSEGSSETANCIIQPETISHLSQQNQEYRQLEQVLYGVAVTNGLSQPIRWAGTVGDQLDDIGISSIRHFVVKAPQINDLLFEEGHPKLPESLLEGILLAIADYFIPVPVQERALMANERHEGQAKFWVADTGASTHMGNCDEGMFDTRDIDDDVRVGNGAGLKATKIGKKRVTIKQHNGDHLNVILTDYKFVPGLCENLLSILKLIDSGWNIGNNGGEMFVEKGLAKIRFDREKRTASGRVAGVTITPRLAGSGTGKTEHSLSHLHALFGHPSVATTKHTADTYEMKCTGQMEACENCKLAKITQKPVAKVTGTVADRPGKRLFIDSSRIKATSLGGSKFWAMAVDDNSDYTWSFFVRNKDDQNGPFTTLFGKLKREGRPVKFIRCDNAGENRVLEQQCETMGFEITFEYTAPNTPQLNGKVERKFATLYARVRAALNGARLPSNLRSLLWCEAAKHMTLIENHLTTTTKPVPSQIQMFGRCDPAFERIHIFGEMAVVKNRAALASKLSNRGITVMYMGHAESHAADTHRFLNPRTRKLIISCDVQWLGRSYGAWRNLPVRVQHVDGEEDEGAVVRLHESGGHPPSMVVSSTPTPAVAQQQPVSTTMAPPPAPSTRLSTALRQLGDHNAPGATESRISSASRTTRSGTVLGPSAGRDDLAAETTTESSDGEDEAANVLIDRHHADFAFSAEDDSHEAPIDYDQMDPTKLKDILENPDLFEEAWDHECPWQRKKWREAILKELKKMRERIVWRKIKLADKPADRRLVKCKWIFEIKRNGVFRARLVACGYSQVPGVDFTDSYSPVASDVSARVVMVVQIVNTFVAILADVETAFLYGDFKPGEEIYMECPKGLEHESDECLLLLKTIYGLVQAALAFYRTFRKALQKCGFVPNPADPCVLTRRTATGGVTHIVIHVDDCYLCGDEATVNESVKLIEEHFKLKIERPVRDYLSCELELSKDKRTMWVGQPTLIGKLEGKFSKMVKGRAKVKTPGTPGFGIVRPKEGDPVIDPESQKLYRSGVGMLLYLVKHSRPDIANAARELSKCMDKATPAAYKELMRLIKFVLDTKSFGLRLSPNPDLMIDGKWNMVIYSDSDWAGDKDNRISVTGFIIFLLSAPIMWRSKAQKSVSTSSAESEYKALSEAAKEIKFIYQLLRGMGIVVMTPITVRVDNVGAIFMAENVGSSSRTRHIDTCYHFVREFIVEEFLKIIFVKSAENRSDGFTKNVGTETYNAHAEHYIISREEFRNHPMDPRKGVERSNRPDESAQMGELTASSGRVSGQMQMIDSERKVPSEQMPQLGKDQIPE